MRWHACTHRRILPVSGYDDLIDYALTIDGYRYAEEVWQVPPNTQEHWKKVQYFKKRPVEWHL